MKRTLIGALALVLGTGAAALTTDVVPVVAAGDDPVLAWNEITSEAAVRSGISPLYNPLHESRMFALWPT